MAFMGISCKNKFITYGVKDVDNIRPVRLYKHLLENEFEFDYLSIKFSAVLEDISGNQSFSGVIRIKHDSIIWISLRSFNIEGARIAITQDSIKFLNRLNTTYFVGDYRYLTEAFAIDLDYSSLEAIITNNFFFYPPLTSDDSVKAIQNFKSCDDSAYYCMSSISQRKFKRYYIDRRIPERKEKKLGKDDSRISYETNEFVFQIIKVYPTIFKISEMLVENYYQNQKMRIFYDKHFKVGTQDFPNSIKINISTNSINSTINFSIENVILEDKSLSFPFKITEKYQEIKLE
jgi:hypothetical protein